MINFKEILRPTRTSKLFALLTTFICLSVVSINSWQANKSLTSDEIVVHERIAKIMSDTLKEAEGVVDGVRVSFKPLPSNKAIEEIKLYGDNAVPVLVEYFHSESPRERELALRFLGHLGGERIIAPLRDIIFHDPSPDLRVLALRWLTQAPWYIASLIIREAAERDIDEHVRQEAREILTSYATK